MKKTVIFAISAILAGALVAHPCTAQGPPAGAPAPKAGKAQVPKFIITGTVTKYDSGYFIQGTRPPEVFTILNPDPQVLDKLIKSGKTVTIEARSEGGDNVAIDKIDGKPYQGPRESKPKGK